MSASDTLFGKEEAAKRFRSLRSETKNPRMSWLLLIKELRAVHGCSILDAERKALDDPRRREWVERSINAGNPCRKLALAHIRYNGSQSLIVREGDTFKFRIPTP